MAHLLQDSRTCRIIDQITSFVRIEYQVIELLCCYEPISPAILQPDVLAQAIIAVGKHWHLAIPKALDVLPTSCTHCTLWLVCRMVSSLTKDGIMYLIRLLAN